MNTEERLIKSAQELLWERGYVGMSPKAIQVRADVGQGSMYHHFTGKPDLARKAILETAEEMKEGVEAILSRQESSMVRIEAYLQRERDVLKGCRIGRLIQDPEIVANPALREPLSETFAWLRSRLADVLADGVRSGEFIPTFDPIWTATTIVATLQGAYVLARAADSTVPFEEAIQGLLQLIRSQEAKR